MSEIARGAWDDADEPEDVAYTEDHNVLWIRPEQPPKRAFLRGHAGELALFATCDDCGLTTRTTPALHLFLACGHCDGEITIAWDAGLG